MLAHVASQIIPCSPFGPGSVNVPPISTFIIQIVKKGRVKSSMLLLALVYLLRFKNALPNSAQGKDYY